jgi:thymidylate synthase (FAD)
MLIEKEKYDEEKVSERAKDSSFDTFKSVSVKNLTGHKISVLYKQEIKGYEFDFERRPHIFYTLFIENFSRAVLQELMRHDDLLAATVKSSRFTLKELKDEEINVESIKKYVISPEDDEIKESQKNSLTTIKNLLNKNVKIDKIKYMLPEGYKTKAVLTYNVKNLKNLIKLRTESNTKVLWEFYELAELIRKITEKI